MALESEDLRSYSLFGGLLPDHLAMLRQHLGVEEFPPGTTIIREGERGDRIYFLAKGAVQVLKCAVASPDGAPVEIARLKQGDAFGEMELVDLLPRSSTVRALDACRCLTLRMPDLLDFQRQHPEVLTLLIMNLARDMSRRLRKADERIAALVTTASPRDAVQGSGGT